VSLGPDQPFAPPAPTWREHLRALGHRLETSDEIERVCREHDLPLGELDVRLNGFGWEDRWDNFTGPQAKAHHMLKGLDLGGAGSELKQAGGIGYCNITKCCTTVCPENITITDNAIIPLKERVVDEFYDPLAPLLKMFRRKT